MCPPDTPMDIWTFAFVPLYGRKQGHHDPKQATVGGEELAIEPWGRRKEVLVSSLALPTCAGVFLLGVSGR